MSLNVTGLKTSNGGSISITEAGGGSDTTSITQPDITVADITYNLPTIAGATEDEGYLKYTNAGTLLSWDPFAELGPAGGDFVPGNRYVQNLAGGNLAIGTGAMSNIGSTMTNNLAIGVNAMNAMLNVAGSKNNVCVGRGALGVGTSGEDNVSYGRTSLGNAVSTGDRNIAIGRSTLFNQTTGSDNVVFGRSAFIDNTTGSQNIVIGFRASGDNAVTNQTRNVVIGSYALRNMAGEDSVHIGRNCADGNGTTNKKSVMFGFDVMQSDAQSVEDTVMIGDQTGGGLGNLRKGNIVLGSQAGQTINRNNNIIIGHKSDCPATSTKNLILGPNITASGVNNEVRIIPTLRTNATAALQFNSTTGQIGLTASSQRFKTDIRDLEIDSSQIYSLQPKSFDFITEDRALTKQFGLIAEEVVDVLPELVHYCKGDPEGVSYPLLNVLLLDRYKQITETGKNIENILQLINGNL